MSILFIADVIIGFIGLVVIGIAIFFIHDATDKRGARRLGFAILALGVVLLIFTSFTSVPAQSVGVVTSFGKPVNDLDPGLHGKAPWQRVHDMDGKVQIDDNYVVVVDGNQEDRRTPIRLGSGSNAWVQNSLRWKINQPASEGLWADYRKTEAVSTGLVDQELTTALNAAFATYDPVGTAQSGGATYDTQTTATLLRLNQKVGNLCDGAGTKSDAPCNKIIFESLAIPKVDFDDSTQGKIEAFQAEQVNTKIASQRVKTAEQEKLALAELDQDMNQNKLVARCQDMVGRGQAPPGFQCWPGTSGGVVAAR